LALNPGLAVSYGTIVDRLWGDQPSPRNVRSALYATVSRLRRCLAAVDATVTWTCGGYRLDIDPDQVDLHRARRLAAQARELATSDREAAAVLLANACRLWRGAPLGGLHGDWAARVREALGQERLTVLTERFEAELACGRHTPAMTQLAAAHAEFPLAEPLAAQLMLALYRSGRQADALAVFASIRQRLVDEIGDEPGEALQQLHQRILRRHPALAGGRGTEAGGDPPVLASLAIPRQLPAPLRTFVGREREMRWLDALLEGEGPAGLVVVTIDGGAGVGKTTLAVHWAHRVADRFPDGQLYVNLRGAAASGAMSSAAAVRGLLDSLGAPTAQIPANLDGQAGLYRTLMAGRRMLLVLDNASDAEQVRPLLPGSPGCLVVVTSRHQLSGLVAVEGAHPLTLGPLTDQEARAILARRLGAGRVAAEPEAVDEITSRCAWLPLALVIVAARAATSPDRPLAELAAGLRDARGRLDALAGPDAAADIRTVFSFSYRALHPAAARLFRLLGLHPGPDLATSAAASLAGVPLAELTPLLRELAQWHLISQHRPGRFTMHDLLHAYAWELAHRCDPSPRRRAGLERLLDHYLYTAHTAATLLFPSRQPLRLPPPPAEVTTEKPADHAGALDWFTTEHATLLAAVQQAADEGFNRHTWQLAWTLLTYLDRRGYWRELAHVYQIGLDAAIRQDDLVGQAHAYRGVARAHTRLKRYDEAHTQLRHALDRYRQLGDLVGQAHALNNMSQVFGFQHRYHEALHHAQRALELYAAAGDERAEAHALNDVGWFHAVLEEHQPALGYCQQALDRHLASGDCHGQANAADSLGYVHHRLGNHRLAIEHCQQALTLYREFNSRYGQAHALNQLGDSWYATGDHEAGRANWREALDLFDELVHPDADEVRMKLGNLGS
jgi:DNA-binding SARP family transcriptional activator/tetratricopeptide (TPR) repeat protein